MNKTKKIIISTFSVLGIILISFGLIANASYNFGKKDYNNLSKKVEVTHKKIETYKAIDKGIYDLEGNLFQIQGINYGNLLIQEGWMSVNSLGPKLNEDGSYAKINSEGVINSIKAIDGALQWMMEHGETTVAMVVALAGAWAGIKFGSIVDGFSILGFTQNRPHGKGEGYGRYGKFQKVRQVQNVL